MTEEFDFDPGEEESETPATVGELQDLVEDLILTVEQARGRRMVSLDRDDTVEKLRQLRERLPEELRTARWMAREREAFIAQTNERAAELLQRAKDKAAEMVSETYVMREAVEEANVLVRNTEIEASQVRLGAEDVAETTFVRLEELLTVLISRVQDRRAELHKARPAPPEVPISE